MDNYSKNVEIRWSDLDPNFHLRHSVYYDWGAFTRIAFLAEHGLSTSALAMHSFGPIIFREECIFKREIVFGDKVAISLFLQKCRKDFSRWTMVHEIWKNSDTLSAIVTVDGAWIDTKLRKLTIPPTVVNSSFEAIPKASDFIWT